MRTRREKVFGPGCAVPLDRNAKARIVARARAWKGRQRREGQQHEELVTRAALDVLQALLWGFHNSTSGVCFPSYEAIAAKAGCARSTVAKALRALELAGVLTWQNRITRIRERCTDLFGGCAWRWRVIRTSNAYTFRDPVSGGSASKSENRSGTLNQEVSGITAAAPIDPASPLERALARLAGALAAKAAVEGSVAGRQAAI